MSAWNLQAELTALKEAALYRQPRALDASGGPRVFCSNDYLGLAQHPRVREALALAAQVEGVGSSGAHLVTGHRVLHDRLAVALARWTGRERALTFSTGYMANIGVLQALVGRGDAVFSDQFNHASLIDGARLSRATVVPYRHNDLEDLERHLKTVRARRRLIVTDAVFSMDGDLAPLRELAEVAARHDAWLMVDDAHGIGVLGKDGAGTLSSLALSAAQAPVLVGTLGKALGTFGAFVAGSAELIEYLVQRARSYMFTTAPPPALAAATLASLELVRNEPERRAHLQRLVARFRDGAQALGLPLMPSATPIQPLWVGEAETALVQSRALERAGFLVTAIRPPTVPKGGARLRITLSAAHSAQDVDDLLEALAKLDLP